MASRSEACLSDFRSAAEAVRLVLMAALPPGSPPSFREIAAARFTGSGRGRVAVADLVMFDGLPATAEVFAGGKMLGHTVWGHRWTKMAGGPCVLEDGRWQRVVPDLPLIPAE